MKEKCYENYPAGFVIIANLLQLSIYIIGAVIISRLGIIWLGIYILYIILLETRLLRRSCINCYYYGKFCAFGKGKLCSILFKKGNPKNFLTRSITWKDMLPDFLVSLVPVVTGIVLMITDFNWTLLVLVVLLFILTSAGNSFVRGSLACKHCKQRQLGCPADKLFNKKK
ncbi:hypothetical protein KY359_01640 [Candidatus Woesearchaeota archaeon]|nr:hypothetical protein [Candidatus Woesearchaeota archaeon]